MPFNLLILAQDDSSTQLFYVIAVLILTIGSALFEKMKQKSAESERKQRGPKPRPDRPAIPPPVQQEAGERRFPPPVAPPPWSAPERPARPAPLPPVPPRPAPRPQQARTPKRRPQIAPEPVRQPTRPPRGISSTVEQAVRQLEGQAGADVRARADLLQPAQSLAQMRSAKEGTTAATAEPAGFRKPTMAELRRAIILNEILGQPVGLREVESGA